MMSMYTTTTIEEWLKERRRIEKVKRKANIFCLKHGKPRYIREKFTKTGYFCKYCWYIHNQNACNCTQKKENCPTFINEKDEYEGRKFNEITLNMIEYVYNKNIRLPLEVFIKEAWLFLDGDDEFQFFTTFKNYEGFYNILKEKYNVN